MDYKVGRRKYKEIGTLQIITNYLISPGVMLIIDYTLLLYLLSFTHIPYTPS